MSDVKECLDDMVDEYFDEKALQIINSGEQIKFLLNHYSREQIVDFVADLLNLRTREEIERELEGMGL